MTEPKSDQAPEPQLLALPAPTPRRIVALTEAGAPLTRAYARVVQALRDSGAEVIPLAVPRNPEPTPEKDSPSIAELKRGLSVFARDLVRGLRGAPMTEPEPWLASQLRAIEGTVDAVLAIDPDVARSAFPACERVWPHVLRLGLDADYHLDPSWKDVDLDAIVTAYPGLGHDLPRVRDGRARVFIGGPVAADDDIPARKLEDGLPLVVVSFARLDPGDVDPLLFQLSLARPERFSLLFLPSQRPGVDELVRARAGNYGLRGKRPKVDADLEPWLRGASALIGFPSPTELATAAMAKVPTLFFTPESRLENGDRFLLAHGALLSEVPITIAVHLESLLPQGSARDKAIASLGELEPSGPKGAAQACLAAIKSGRPAAPATPPPQAAPKADDDLEDIGDVPASSAPSATTDLPIALRRAYLKEIILHQNNLERNLTRAKAGLETWQRRVRLARSAGDDPLADKAVPRVEGLLKVLDQLEREMREVKLLRERFASQAPLTAADRAAAGRFLSPSTAASLDRNDAPESAFTRLELEDALAVLKRKLGDK
jgi:hypothetical protein